MKRGTPEHPKLLALCRALNIGKAEAVGTLELLWHFTAKFAPSGDIGRHEDRAIAMAVGWKRPSGTPGVTPECKLSDALVTTGWLDRCPCHRLVVHDWHDHADQSVTRMLARQNLAFASCLLAKTRLPVPVPMPVARASSQYPEPSPPHVPSRARVCQINTDLFEVFWELFVGAGKPLSDRDKERALRRWLNYEELEHKRILEWTVEQMKTVWRGAEFTPMPFNALVSEGWTRVAAPRIVPDPDDPTVKLMRYAEEQRRLGLR